MSESADHGESHDGLRFHDRTEGPNRRRMTRRDFLIAHSLIGRGRISDSHYHIIC